MDKTFVLSELQHTIDLLNSGKIGDINNARVHLERLVEEIEQGEFVTDRLHNGVDCCIKHRGRK